MLLDEMLNTIDINEFSYIGESTNAKLYDVSMYSDSNNLDPWYFDDFCAVHFDAFKEYLKDVGANLEFIGRTSSFYFIPAAFEFNCYYMNRYEDSEPEERRRMLWDEFLYHAGLYDSMEEMINAGWTVDEMKKEWTQYCADVLTPINQAWEYLELFKLNQLNSFIEYIEAA